MGKLTRAQATHVIVASPSFFGGRTRRPVVALFREKNNDAIPQTHSRDDAHFCDRLRSRSVAAPASAQVPFPPDSTVQVLLQQLVNSHGVKGIVVGLLDENGTRRVIAHGDSGPGALPLDGESVFEIGSMTKVFTGILLADMVRRGEVELTDPVADLLPRDVRVPERNGKPITLLDLTTHSSGLPMNPTNRARVESRESVRRLHREPDVRVSFELRASARSG